ncbi:MAG: DNA polymerase I [Oscillospiraceae bacterium]|jgi:DNA polymerase-1|nr:DNA polymerase I [Oscillospiraceae bacterium]
MVLDGNSLINRAFYGIRLFSNKEGLYTNAVYGFVNILLKLMEEERPDGICVAFDTRAATFRAERYEQYKATRTGMPEELAVQMPVLKETLDAMNIVRLELDGYEADDILGTLARIVEESGNEGVVVTGDRDSLQLVSERIKVKLVTTSMGQSRTTDYTPEVFAAEYGFAPEKLVDLKALMGDSSDNIPGVAGIGKKTAGDLVCRFGSIESIYADLDTLDIKPAVRGKLEAGRDMAYLSYELATIDKNVPVDVELKAIDTREYDCRRLYKLFLRLEFRQLIEKLKLSGTADKEEDSGELISCEVIKLSEKSMGALDGFSSPVSVVCGASLHAVAICTGDAVYTANERDFSNAGYKRLLDKLFSGRVEKYAHDVKTIYSMLIANGIEYGGFKFDTALGAYLCDPTAGSYTIEKLALSYLGREIAPSSMYREEDAFGLLTGNGEAESAMCEHSRVIHSLQRLISPVIEENGMQELYYGLELPLCEALAEMESAGMYVDSGMLMSFSAELQERIEAIRKKIFDSVGEEFNINSTKELGRILFDKLGLPPVKKTKTGYSTDVEVLQKLAGKHKIIEEIISYRQFAKLKSTYCDGLLKVIGEDGRIHSKFNMMVTATGRLSSTEPNLQNIPIRRELGSEIRKMFVAGEGCVFVDADYSQIELRVLAHIAGDRAMIEAFKAGDDIHTITASQVFGVSPENVTSELRRRAKAVNFGIVYGISDFSLAEDLGVSKYEAKQYIDDYLRHYSGIASFMKEVVADAKEKGYVLTIMNRRRYLPELKSSNYNIRSFGERAAMNTPIQGSAADIIKLAMLNVWRRLRAEGLAARLVLQVHDELIVEAPEAECGKVRALLTEEMQNVIKLDLPLVAEAAWAKNWYDAK